MTHGSDLVSNGKLTECLEFVLETMFPDLEMVMESVIEALTTFNEKCKYFGASKAPVLTLFSIIAT